MPKYKITPGIRKPIIIEAPYLPTGTGQVTGGSIQIELAFDINRLRIAICGAQPIIELVLIELMVANLRDGNTVRVSDHVRKIMGCSVGESDAFVDAWVEDLGL